MRTFYEALKSERQQTAKDGKKCLLIFGIDFGVVITSEVPEQLKKARGVPRETRRVGRLDDSDDVPDGAEAEDT